MVRIIDEHLKIVENKVCKLWDLTITAYENVYEAFENNNRKLALKISKDDKIINDLEEELNDDTIKTITLQSPVASDLRLLISALKIANQLERIADYTVNVSDHILIDEGESGKTSSSIVDKQILEMIKYIISMLEGAKIAFETQNVELAKEIIAMDVQLDKIYTKSVKKLSKLVSDEEKLNEILPEISLNSVLLVKYLERSGDHIVNIAESIFYMVKGRNYDAHHTATMFDDEGEE